MSSDGGAATEPAPSPGGGGSNLHGSPSAAELVAAVRELLEGRSQEQSDERLRHELRIAARALAVVEREITLSELDGAHRRRLQELGCASDEELACAIRGGAFDDRWDHIKGVLREAAIDRLLVANPAYLEHR